jgi:hypothetical protein
MDSRAASRVESGLRRPRTASSTNCRSVCRHVRDVHNGWKLHDPPFWPDGTERPLQRPTDPEEPQEDYRGTTKGHTRKNLLVITESCSVCLLSHTDDGKASDKSLAELAGSTSPPGSYLSQDRGFQGCCLQDVTIVQPQKTPRGGELTPPEKATNRRISSISIRIEHAIGGVKRDRIVKDKLRLLKDGIRDTIMETCCGLHNFRLQYRPWYYAS